MITKTFYAIYNPKTKKFKGRGNISGSRWTDEPTQTYDSRGRAEGALKTHTKMFKSHPLNKNIPHKLEVKEITVSWEE